MAHIGQTIKDRKVFIGIGDVLVYDNDGPTSEEIRAIDLLYLVCNGKPTLDASRLNNASDILKTKIRNSTCRVVDGLISGKLLIGAIVDFYFDVTSIDVISG